MVQTIHIQGKPVTIDEEFSDLLLYNQWLWTRNGYLASFDENGRLVFFHLFMLPPRIGLSVQHIDGNHANNTSKNLAYWTKKESHLEIERLNPGGFFGVRKKGRRYEAYYKAREKDQLVGRYSSALEAATNFDLFIHDLFPAIGPRNHHYFPNEIAAYLLEMEYLKELATQLLPPS